MCFSSGFQGLWKEAYRFFFVFVFYGGRVYVVKRLYQGGGALQCWKEQVCCGVVCMNLNYRLLSFLFHFLFYASIVLVDLAV